MHVALQEDFINRKFNFKESLPPILRVSKNYMGLYKIIKIDV